MNYLLDAVEKKMVKLQQEVESWEDAIKLCGSLFEASGVATSAYTQAMIDSSKKNNAYIVITPHIAMPHAGAESGVLKTGVSIVTLKTPINFGHKDHDPVSLVIALAAKSHEDLEHTLGAMLTLFSDEESIAKLNKATTLSEVETIVKQIKSY